MDYGRGKETIAGDLYHKTALGLQLTAYSKHRAQVLPLHQAEYESRTGRDNRTKEDNSNSFALRVTHRERTDGSSHHQSALAS